MNKPVNLVIFDCDGVLVDSEHLANTLFASICRDMGFEITDEEAMEHFPGNRFSSCVQYVEAKNGRPVPPDILPLFRQQCTEVFAARLLPIDGMAEVLNRIHRPKVVASNGPKDKMVENLITCKLFHYFKPDHIFSAYDINKWKPEPDLFLMAAHVMGVPPDECLVLEDSTPGVQAAQAAGMRVVGFTHSMKNKKLLPLGISLIHQPHELYSFL